jgi:hypothetical protein
VVARFAHPLGCGRLNVEQAERGIPAGSVFASATSHWCGAVFDFPLKLCAMHQMQQDWLFWQAFKLDRASHGCARRAVGRW